MCKFVERLVHRLLTWLLEEHCILPDEHTGFPKSRGTAETLADLRSTLEDAKFNQNMVHVVLLDVGIPFASLPHATILDQLCLNDAQVRHFAYLESFLKDKLLSAKACGITNAPQVVSQGVSQGSVLKGR